MAICRVYCDELCSLLYCSALCRVYCSAHCLLYGDALGRVGLYPAIRLVRCIMARFIEYIGVHSVECTTMGFVEYIAMRFVNHIVMHFAQLYGPHSWIFGCGEGATKTSRRTWAGRCD